MQTDPAYSMRGTFSHPAVGLFTEWQAANDAIADLAQVGFSADQIIVAYSVEGEQAQHESHRKNSKEEHGLIWKLRCSFEHDLHRRGADQMTGGDETAASGKDAPNYSEGALRDTLLSMGASEDRISLLDRELGRNGVLVLVRTDDRLDEVESIIERDRGYIRTNTVAEHTPPGGES